MQNNNPGESESFDKDTERILDHVQFKSYRRRWYILAVYSAAAFLQGYIWNMWGPIYFSMKRYLDWSPAQLSLLPFYGSVTLTFLTLHSAQLLHKIQLRGLLLIMTSLVSLSTICRCVHFHNVTVTTVLINISAVLNGCAGVVTFYMPAFISSRWFPPHEHKLATAIGVTLNSCGLAFAYLFGPIIVTQTDDVSPSDNINQYYLYTYIETGIALALFLLVVIYYPSSPPSPPSHSATTVRSGFWTGCYTLLKSRTFWLVSAPAYLMFATVGIWLSVIPLDMAARSISQDRSDSIGFYGALVGSILGIVVGKLADVTADLKAIMLALASVTVIATAWLLLVKHGVIVYSFTQVFIAGVAASACSFSMLPLNFELSVEMCFPVDESSVVGMMGLGISIMQNIFLSIMFVPNIGASWMDYFLVVGCTISLPILISIKPIYKRYNDDIT